MHLKEDKKTRTIIWHFKKTHALWFACQFCLGWIRFCTMFHILNIPNEWERNYPDAPLSILSDNNNMKRVQNRIHPNRNWYANHKGLNGLCNFSDCASVCFFYLCKSRSERIYCIHQLFFIRIRIYSNQDVFVHLLSCHHNHHILL